MLSGVDHIMEWRLCVGKDLFFFPSLCAALQPLVILGFLAPNCLTVCCFPFAHPEVSQLAAWFALLILTSSICHTPGTEFNISLTSNNESRGQIVNETFSWL